ncbi:MAG: alpha-amylase family glycosyl hydrolase [Polyangia bacterium]
MSRRLRARSVPLVAVAALAASCSEPAAPPTLLPDAAAPAAAPPASRWLRDSIGYEIFVRSFADSDGDGSGDLRGVTARLDTLRELGVDLLWLTPIHPSPSYHGYDVTDYGAVHPDFGTLADFSQLVEAAHRRGMRVLLDLVLNHTSNQHPWFVAANRGGSAAGRYLFRGDQPGWMWQGKPVWRSLGGQPPRSYLGLFSGVMPDLNLRDEDTVRAMEDVIGLWLDRGADGYRLDAARYLIEWPDPVSAAADKAPAFSDTADTHALLRRLRKTALGRRADAALIGEVWTDLDTIARYAGSGDELHGCFSFPLAGAVVDGLSRGAAAPLRDVLEHLSRSGTEPGFFLPFLSNHDQRRVASSVPGDALRLAATLLLGMPGTPFLYYGEELGLTQAATAGDRGQRQSMPWDQVAAQQRDPGSLWQHYRRLIELRRGTAALRSPALLPLAPTGPSGQPDDRLLAFRRGDRPEGAVVAVYNLGTSAVSGAVLELPADHPLGPVRDLLSDGARPPAVTDTTRRRYPLPALPPRSALWLTPAAMTP